MNKPSEWDWFRGAMYGTSVIFSLVAIFITPINAEWVEPFNNAANLLAAVSVGTALTHFKKAGF